MDPQISGRLVLARHGRTTLNAAGVLRGLLDPPLDEVGEAEALALGRALAPLRPARVRTSPLRRAVRTGQVIAEQSAGQGVVSTPDPGLLDRDYGEWAGQERGEVEARFGSLDAAPGVEPVAQVLARARAALDAQVQLLAAGTVVLVAHDAVNRQLLAQLDPSLGDPESIPQRTACWNLLSFADGVWRVEEIDQKPA